MLVTVVIDEASYGPVQLWKTDGTLIATLVGKSESQGYAYVDVSFSSDGKTLATAITNGDSSGPIKLWKADGTLITTLVEKSDSAASVSFSEKGQTLGSNQKLRYSPNPLPQVDIADSLPQVCQQVYGQSLNFYTTYY